MFAGARGQEKNQNYYNRNNGIFKKKDCIFKKREERESKIWKTQDKNAILSQQSPGSPCSALVFLNLNFCFFSQADLPS